MQNIHNRVITPFTPLVIAGLLAGSSFTYGCLPDSVPNEDESTGDEDPQPENQEEACGNCPEEAFACSCNDPLGGGWQPPKYGCTLVDKLDYADSCRTLLNKSPMTQLFEWEFNCECILCEEGTPTGGPVDDPVCSLAETPSCTGWDPDSMIGFSSGVYSMDATVITNLLGDASPLLRCDDARLVALPSPPGFEVEDADADELLYELGLRDGDIPLALNGMPLETAGDAVIAVSKLWWEEGETEYELDLLRGMSNVMLEYSVYFSPP